LQDFFFEVDIVGTAVLLGVIYLCFVGVRNWVFVFYICSVQCSHAGLELEVAGVVVALLCWLCSKSQLLGAIKGRFVGQSLNFFLH
jgi:hypothetical protein